MDCWVAPYGVFKKSLHDNGGEFSSEVWRVMADIFGFEDLTGAAQSPWSYGIVERHHAVLDRTLQSLMKDFPKHKTQTLLSWAITVTGWSPFQIVYGRNPVLPSLVDSSPAQLKEVVISRVLREHWDALNAAPPGRSTTPLSLTTRSRRC